MSTHVAPELLEEAERLRTALREIEQATEGIPEQNCMIANRIARLALRDTAPDLPTSQPARAIAVCKRAGAALRDPAPAEEGWGYDTETGDEGKP